MVKLAIKLNKNQTKNIKISEKDIVACKIEKSKIQQRTDLLLIEDTYIESVRFFQNKSQKYEDIVYCRTNFDLTEENLIQPLFYPYYQKIYIIRKLEVNNDQNIDQIKEEKSHQEFHMLFYFKEQKFCHKFFMEFNNLELHPSQYFSLFKCECVVFYSFFDKAELFLIDCFELPTCLSCLYSIESEVTYLSIPKQEKNHTCYMENIEPKQLICEVCHIQKDIWICMLCGYMFCGRYQKSHGVQHYSKTQHRFSIDIQKQIIWDYIEDRFVQKLNGEISKYDDNEIFDNITNLVVEQNKQKALEQKINYPDQSQEQQYKQQLQNVIDIQLEQQKQYYLKKEEDQYQQDEKETQRIEEEIKEKENILCWFQDVIEQKKNYMMELDRKLENQIKVKNQKESQLGQVNQQVLDGIRENIKIGLNLK